MSTIFAITSIGYYHDMLRLHPLTQPPAASPRLPFFNPELCFCYTLS